MARVVRVDALDDGRYAVIAVGTRRIRVNAWLPDDPYPLADVDDWPDEEPDAEGLAVHVAASHARVRAAHRAAAALGDVAPDVELEISDDPLLASYHLAAIAPLGPADRYRLLCARSPAERLDALDAALDDVDAMLRFRAAAASDDG